MKTLFWATAAYTHRTTAVFFTKLETFLLGNIARGGVVGTISRKAISPLSILVWLRYKSGIAVCLSFLREYLFPVHPVYKRLI